jgi:NAD(P)-dependent dehydrogenase (short-subunit alcohol dehydrogenase family)
MNVLITGANRGIGLSWARAYRKRDARVIGTAREPGSADDLRDIGADVEEVDVTDDASVAMLAERLQGVAIDLLILNAGILRRDTADTVDTALMSRQFDTNALGALRVALALRPNLALAEKPSLVAMTSRMGSIADNTSGGFYGYRASKAALNAIMKSLAIDLAPWPVILLHPGYIATRMTGNQGDFGPDEAVDRMIAIVDRLDESMTGRFYHRDGHELPW